MDTNELIAQYFQNTLTPETKREFDLLMKTDPDFAQQVNFQKNLQTVIKKEEQDQVKATLQSFEEETGQTQTHRTFSLWWIAASTIALLAITGLLYFGQDTPSHEELFASNFEPYRNIIAPVSRGNEKNTALKLAFFNYDTKNYQKASQQFADLYVSDSQSYFLFYQGICELELNNPEMAIKLLNSHSNFKDKLSNQTNWYLALAYLSANQIDKASVLLKTVIDKKQYNHKKAKDLLLALE